MDLTLVTPQTDLSDFLMPLLNSAGINVNCINQLAELQASDLVIYAPDRFSEKDLQAFIAHPLSDQAEWILISDGKPSPHLDQMMTSGVSSR